MKIEEAILYLQSLARQKTDAYDIVASTQLSESVSVFQGKLQNTEISESVGLGIRVFKKHSPGYAHTERLSKEALQQTLEDAITHTRFTEALPIQLPSPQALEDVPGLYNPALQNLSLAEMTDFCLALEQKALAQSSEIENIPYLGADRVDSSFFIANSEGAFYTRSRNHVSAGMGSLAQRDGIKKLGFYVKSGLEWKDFDASFMASQSVERALELLSPAKIKNGSFPVVFSERVAGTVFSMYSSSFFADTIQKGQSRLENAWNTKIAPDFLNLWSDPFRSDLPASAAFDGEGVPTQKIQLIEDGVFTNKLYNLESALQENASSNGAASRSFSGSVNTSFKNLIVSPGDYSNEELFNLFPKCFLVLKLEGNSGCSAISGEMSVGAQGIWFENGKPKHAVENLTLNINFFDLLKRLVGIGNIYNDSFSSVKVPALAVSDVAISN